MSVVNLLRSLFKICLGYRIDKTCHWIQELNDFVHWDVKGWVSQGLGDIAEESIHVDVRL